ncbi:MAG: MBL fold metallo-hydrolase [Limnohabitans sp.]
MASNIYMRWARCVLACLAGFGRTAHAVDITFAPVGEGVYAYIGDTEGRTYENEAINANIGLIVTHAGAVLIDSGASFQGAEKIARAVARVTSQPIRWVINTGGQDHRWLGNGYFQAAGADIIAHAHAQKDMIARGQEQLSALQPILKERLQGTTPTLPNRLIQGADTHLVLGSEPIDILYRNGGHTPGDVIVWLPRKNILFSGDLVYVDRILGMHAVSQTKTWLDSFAVIDALKPAVIVPGHGAVTTLTKARTDTRDLLVALRSHMAKAVEAGTDISAAVKSFNASPFQHLQHADVRLPQLANRTYLEVERE